MLCDTVRSKICKYFDILWKYIFDRIFCSSGIVKLCPVSASTHLRTFHLQGHLCFDGLKARRTFAIGLNSEIPRFTSYAPHLCVDRCEGARAVLFYQNLVRNNSLAKDGNYFGDFSRSMQPGIGKSLLAEQNFACEQVTVRIQLSAVRPWDWCEIRETYDNPWDLAGLIHEWLEKI